MTVVGRVSEWYDDEGWGVVETATAPGGCWLHFSSLLVAGHRHVEVGQDLELSVVAGDQEGYRFRADEAWPVGTEPHRPPEHHAGDATAFHSTLTLSFDDVDGPDGPDAEPPR
ncbi:hypothetical protein [Nocardioides sp.]|uniref:hypothetical protein n=1 Tax=Nocardioides sp. TaxID=35761 RepID=UPI002717CC61|nr:hypothetical protein [Nocardioides sp.]MDO9456610.1 hypothetical protein [Nocardioides sp.]